MSGPATYFRVTSGPSQSHRAPSWSACSTRPGPRSTHFRARGVSPGLPTPRFVEKSQIHRRGNQFALIIDDWHRVSGSPASRILAFLLENGCHHLQLVVTSRNQAGLPISQLRVRDELTEVDATALRFDADEVRAFVLERCGL